MRAAQQLRVPAFALALALLAGCAGEPAPLGSPSVADEGATTSTDPSPAASGSLVAEPPPSSDATPLAGRVVVVDPGHQLGNQFFPREVNATVDAGMGVTKACNTTGTATNDGYPEATVNWQVSELLVARLRELGAEVVLTRESNSPDLWGPCIDVRGSLANDRADLLLSIHADGAPAGDHGFHVLTPGPEQDIHASSTAFAEVLRAELEAAGFDRATYIADAIRASDEYGTLNRSTKTAAIVELGNMRHDDDAARLTDPDGQAAYAQALADAVLAYLTSPSGG